jgi:uncharacterized protein (TIGR02284 family)
MGLTEKTIDSLNSLLRGEISAVETYRQCIDRLRDDVTIARQLEECQAVHQRHVERLSQLVAQIGGRPATGSGPWGAFAKMVEGSAKIFGVKAAVAALEEGEDHGLKDYREELPKLDASVRAIVETELLPEQERTHQVLSALKRSLSLH